MKTIIRELKHEMMFVLKKEIILKNFYGIFYCSKCLLQFYLQNFNMSFLSRIHSNTYLTVKCVSALKSMNNHLISQLMYQKNFLLSTFFLYFQSSKLHELEISSRNLVFKYF